MAESVAPEYLRFVAGQRTPGVAAAAARAMAEGDIGEAITLTPDDAARLLPVAARQASGMFRPGKHTEVVWVEGESEIAVSLDSLKLEFGNGMLAMHLLVRTDQTGQAEVRVFFACGSPERPAGLYCAAQRRPQGPAIIVEAWGDALVAFAWQCLLAMISGLANATGKDARGNLMVPVEMVVTPRAMQVVPMARHRFAGSSGLKVKAPVARKGTR